MIPEWGHQSVTDGGGGYSSAYLVPHWFLRLFSKLWKPAMSQPSCNTVRRIPQRELHVLFCSTKSRVQGELELYAIVVPLCRWPTEESCEVPNCLSKMRVYHTKFVDSLPKYFALRMQFRALLSAPQLQPHRALQLLRLSDFQLGFSLFIAERCFLNLIADSKVLWCNTERMWKMKVEIRTDRISHADVMYSA